MEVTVSAEHFPMFEVIRAMGICRKAEPYVSVGVVMGDPHPYRWKDANPVQDCVVAGVDTLVAWRAMQIIALEQGKTAEAEDWGRSIERELWFRFQQRPA